MVVELGGKELAGGKADAIIAACDEDDGFGGGHFGCLDLVSTKESVEGINVGCCKALNGDVTSLKRITYNLRSSSLVRFVSKTSSSCM